MVTCEDITVNHLDGEGRKTAGAELLEWAAGESIISRGGGSDLQSEAGFQSVYRPVWNVEHHDLHNWRTGQEIQNLLLNKEYHEADLY